MSDIRLTLPRLPVVTSLGTCLGAKRRYAESKQASVLVENTGAVDNVLI